MPSQDLSEIVKLALNNISSVFDRDQEYTPYFGVALLAERPHFYHIPFFDISHMPGRALDALLMAEDVFGITLDECVVERYRTALLKSFQGSDHLNGYFDPANNQKRVAFHNLREGLQGLHALVKWRNDDSARSLADQMISRINQLVQDDGSWDQDKIRGTKEYLPLGEVVQHDHFYTSTAGRLIGSLVKYHLTTQNSLVLDIAQRFRSRVLSECFDESLCIKESAGWHVHSITSTISSLAQLADCLNDNLLKQQVAQLYRNAFNGIIMTPIGWSKENLKNDLDVGEINNTGDFIQTALFLARWGSSLYFDDIEKMLFSHVIPSQLLDTTWIKEVNDPQGDHERNIRRRVFGAFGFPAPYGQQSKGTDYLNFNFDITCGGMQALCELGREIKRYQLSESTINFFIDSDHPDIQVRSFLPEVGQIYIKTNAKDRYRLRIPKWLDRSEIKVLQNDNDVPVWIDEEYLTLEGQNGGFRIIFGLSEKNTIDLMNETSYSICWHGNHVVDMDPSGGFLPFFNSKH